MATYRCFFCRAETEGPDDRGVPCSKCGRLTARVLEEIEVVVVTAWKRRRPDTIA